MLKSGEADRFNLKIHCAKSSNHILSIYLKDINGKKFEVKRNVHLNICIPRSGSGYIMKEDVLHHNEFDPCSEDLGFDMTTVFDEWL